MKITSIFLLLIITISSYSQETKRVLFIGNSYTYTNDLPSLLEQAAISTGDIVIHDQNTPGGASLASHAASGETPAKIMQGNWDFVVLQEQSQRPALEESYVELNVYPHANHLNDLIEEYNPCGETLFYMTWGRENGDASYCNEWPPVCTYEGMDDLLRQRYLTMAEDNEASASPVGAVWRYIRINHPEIDLYSSDGSHPSLAGSYAAAITFNTAIFKKDPSLISFNSTLSSSIADDIKDAVKTVVFNDFSSWYIDAYQALADFSYVNNGNLEYSFTNNSSYSVDYLWEFGDGNFSTEEHPTHTYDEEGSYEVKLTSNFLCDDSSVKIELLEVVLNVNDFSENTFIVYPNPANNTLFIDSSIGSLSDFRIEMFSVTGKKINIETLISGNLNRIIDIQSIPNGIYFLKIIGIDFKGQVVKFIKE